MVGTGDDAFKIPRSPRQVGIRYALVVFAIGTVAGVVALTIHDTGRSYRNDAFERGFSFGLALVPIMLGAYALGYFRQKRRLSRPPVTGE
jgi:hypothetical protein